MWYNNDKAILMYIFLFTDKAIYANVNILEYMNKKLQLL